MKFNLLITSENKREAALVRETHSSRYRQNDIIKAAVPNPDWQSRILIKTENYVKRAREPFQVPNDDLGDEKYQIHQMKIFSIGKRTDRNGEQNTERRPTTLSLTLLCAKRYDDKLR